MPPFFHLKRSTAHRVACFALYRALLVQCPRIYVPAERWRGAINPIKHLIRKRFHRQQHVQSHRLVIAALKHGYETEALLRAAGDGDEGAIESVFSIIREHQDMGDATRELQARNPHPTKPVHRKPEPYPGAKPMFESRPRPSSEITGLRQVPKLQQTSGIPFLRFKKPQSQFLTRVISDKLKKVTKLNVYFSEFDADALDAKYEDDWDKLIKEGSEKGRTWAETISIWERDVRREAFELKKKNMVIAAKMVDIIDQEQALADQEISDRKVEKRRRKEAEQHGQSLISDE